MITTTLSKHDLDRPRMIIKALQLAPWSRYLLMPLRSCLLLLSWLWHLLRRGWAFIESRIVQELHDLWREYGLLDLRDHLHYPFLDHGLRSLLLLMLVLLLSIVNLIRGLHLLSRPLPMSSRPTDLFMGKVITPNDL